MRRRQTQKAFCRTTAPALISVSYTRYLFVESKRVTCLGDTRGPRETVYELCHPGVPQEAYQPSASIAPCSPSNTSTAYKPHELDYIRHQGGFSSLPPDVCDELVRCYFCHVHFFLPVVEGSTFLNEYAENRCQNVNSLLLWSMFLAATNVGLFYICCHQSKYTHAEIVRRRGCFAPSGLSIAEGHEKSHVYESKGACFVEIVDYHF